MNNYSFLFNSISAAQEVAYALRAKWDGCNGVEILTHDFNALKFAVALCNAEYCKVSSGCDILNNIRESGNVLVFGFSDTITQAIASQMASCFNQNLESCGDNYWTIALQVAQDVIELEQFVPADRLVEEQMNSSTAASSLSD